MTHNHQSNLNGKESAVLRPEIDVFAREMERALRKNEHRGGWRTDEPAALLTRLREEADELESAIKNATGDGKVDLGGSMASPLWWKVIEEAADVANFAMMLADLASRSGIHGLHDLHKIRERLELAPR